MTPEQVPADLVERACRARISAQRGDGKPLDDAEWIALRSNIEEKWMAAALADVMSTMQTLPDATGGCICSYTTEDRGAGHSELVGEYEPACPVHSEHVYDPIQGAWVFRSEVPTNPTKPVDPWAARLDCPRCCPGPCCDHRNTEYGNCTDCHNTGHNHAPCPDHKSNRATNLDGAA